jgi:hypothetical protein
MSGDELLSGSVTKRIMPNTTREIESKWDKTPTFGIFKVQNKVSFLGKVQYNQERIVIVAPIWLIVVLVVILLIIVGLVALLTLFVVKKVRHKRILRQHKNARVGEKN